MRRKIVQQGTATLMVSLPASWARKNGIEKGAEVEVQEQKDRIIILPTAEALAARVEIDVTGMADDLLREIAKVEGTKEKKTYRDPETFKTVRQAMLRMLASLYKAGYDEIRITFEHPGTINLIQEALGDELSEYEIETVIYVRTRPLSRWCPHFNRRNLEAVLPQIGVDYLFRGHNLGGLLEKVDYDKAIDEVVELACTRRIVLMCSEDY